MVRKRSYISICVNTWYRTMSADNELDIELSSDGEPNDKLTNSQLDRYLKSVINDSNSSDSGPQIKTPLVGTNWDNSFDNIISSDSDKGTECANMPDNGHSTIPRYSNDESFSSFFNKEHTFYGGAGFSPEISVTDRIIESSNPPAGIGGLFYPISNEADFRLLQQIDTQNAMEPFPSTNVTSSQKLSNTNNRIFFNGNYGDEFADISHSSISDPEICNLSNMSKEHTGFETCDQEQDISDNVNSICNNRHIEDTGPYNELNQLQFKQDQYHGKRSIPSSQTRTLDDEFHPINISCGGFSDTSDRFTDLLFGINDETPPTNRFRSFSSTSTVVNDEQLQQNASDDLTSEIATSSCISLFNSNDAHLTKSKKTNNNTPNRRLLETEHNTLSLDEEGSIDSETDPFKLSEIPLEFPDLESRSGTVEIPSTVEEVASSSYPYLADGPGKKIKKKRTRRKKHIDTNSETVSKKLWQFLLDTLADEEHNPSVITWLDKTLGTFQICSNTRLAELWTTLRRRDSVKYEFFARALRHYYAKKIIHRLPGKKLSYQFGENCKWREYMTLYKHGT